MSPLSFLYTKTFRSAALAAFLGVSPAALLAEDAPWLILKVAGEEGASGDLFDNYLVNEVSTGVTSADPCFGGRCLPGSMPGQLMPGQLMPGVQSTPFPGSELPTAPPVPGEQMPVPAPGASSTTPSPTPAAPFTDNQQNFVDFNEGFGSNTLLASRDVPAMIGDFFGGGLTTYSGYAGTFSMPNVSNGAVGRLKLAENTNPVPTDRFYLNYSYFNSTVLNGIDVNRATFGLEKTFLNQAMSFEIRMPIVSTLGSSLFTDGDINYNITDTSDVQLGNLQMYLKGVLWEGQNGLISAGLGISLPTADDITIYSFGSPAFVAQNESVHLLPFIGGVYTPTDRCFATTMLQFDIDVNGQPIYDFGSYQGRLRDQEYLFLSQGLGYWLYQEPGLRIAPIAEVHLNQSLSGARSVGPIIGTTDNVTVLNGVLGITSVVNEQLRLTAAYVAPMGIGGADEQFDGEFRFIVNWYFGRSARPTQAGFSF